MIITLCGRGSLEHDFIEAHRTLSAAGHTVLGLTMFTTPNNEIIPEMEELLQELHQMKIRASDCVYVLNKDGYIGKRTQAEIEFAKTLGKKIIYMEERHETD